MKTRCKFRCVSSDGGSATFEVVTGGSPENEAFFSATPSGRLSLGLIHQNLFTVGKEYYLDIIEADPPQVAA